MPIATQARLALAGGALASLLVLTAIAGATPDAASWRRQMLIGQNAEHFFRYVAVSDHPASYYSYSRTLRIEKVLKLDSRVVESVVLAEVTYSQDLNTEQWSEASGAVPSFDLSGYLRTNRVAFAFPSDVIHFRTFAIDSAGVWELFEDGRIRLATRADLERQIPELGEDPRVVGVEETGPIHGGDVFLRIESGSAAWDMNWSEDLLLVRGGTLR